jgi:CBS domain containing-hemolysin-like protein
MVSHVLVLAVLIVLSAFFSAAETAFTSLSVLQLQELKKSRPRRAARIAMARGHSENFLTTVLIANNLVNIAASALVTQLTLHAWGDAFLGVSTGLITLVVLIFGEVTPKRLAISHNAVMCVYSVDVILALSWLLRPLVYFIGAISLVLTRFFGAAPGQKITLEGVIHLVDLAQEGGVLEDDKSQMMKTIIRFNDVKAQAIMTHRMRVFSLSSEETVGGVLERLLEEGYSRIPVYSENPENIVGIVVVKDVWRAYHENENGNAGSGDAGGAATQLKKIMFPPVFVSQQTSIYKLLSTLRQSPANMVVVLDEYGGLAGIVTYEDLIEEIIGEIYDEDEEEDREKITSLADGSSRILGDTPLYLVNDSLGTSFPIRKSSQTLGGFLLDLAGNIPQAGERITTEEGAFVVEKIIRGRIVVTHYLPPLSREEGT